MSQLCAGTCPDPTRLDLPTLRLIRELKTALQPPPPTSFGFGREPSGNHIFKRQNVNLYITQVSLFAIIKPLIRLALGKRNSILAFRSGRTFTR